jgi:predicted secreted protein
MTKLGLALIIMAGLLTFSFAAIVQGDPGSLILHEKDRGRTVTLHPGERLIVELRNPGSGGYETQAPDFNHATLKLVSQKNIPPQPRPEPRAGDFGRLFYEWEAVGPGATDIIIRIHRPWERKTPEEFWRVRVMVAG